MNKEQEKFYKTIVNSFPPPEKTTITYNYYEITITLEYLSCSVKARFAKITNKGYIYNIQHLPKMKGINESVDKLEDLADDIEAIKQLI